MRSSKGIRPVKKQEWWGAGVVICLEQGADLYTAQLMPLPLIVSCFSKIQFGFTSLVPAHPGSPRKRDIISTHIEHIFQGLLGLGSFQTHLGKAEVGASEALSEPRAVPTRPRDIDQAVAEKQNQQRQAPSVACRHRQHFQIISAMQTITSPGARFTKYLTIYHMIIIGTIYDNDLQRDELFPGNITS